MTEKETHPLDLKIRTAYLTPMDYRLRELADAARKKIANFPDSMTQIYDTEEGKWIRVFHVDAREIIKQGQGRYSTEAPASESAPVPESAPAPASEPESPPLDQKVGGKKSR